MSIEEIKQEMSRISWWHEIDLGNGIITPGKTNNVDNEKNVGIPSDLRGKTVLDIGAWDGFYSFECEKRGAAKVLATDSHVWQKKGWSSKEGFLFARKILKSKVEDKEIDILDISPESVGEKFDLVLFLGVLYHMKHPLLALEKVASVTKEMAIIQTHTDMLEIERPVMAFYLDNEFAKDDPTYWCGLNPAAIEAMLKIVGFNKVKLHYSGPMRYKQTGVKGNNDPDIPTDKRIMTNTVIFHAWK